MSATLDMEALIALKPFALIVKTEIVETMQPVCVRLVGRVQLVPTRLATPIAP